MSKRIHVPEDRVRANRAANVRRLLQCFTTKAAMCREGGGVNPSQIEQMFRERSDPTYRPPGHALMRKMEQGLGLPEFSLDEVDGIEQYLPPMIERLRREGVQVKLPAGLRAAAGVNEPSSGRGTYPATPTTALHQATVEALQAALAAGRISDVECAAYIGKWLDAA